MRAADDARILAALNDLSARTEAALSAPGLPAPVVAIGGVLLDVLALLSGVPDEVSGEVPGHGRLRIVVGQVARTLPR